MKKVFKFPDGNGGYLLKCRDEEGIWHICDEDGNIIEEGLSASKDIPTKERVPQPRKASAVKKTYMKISVVTDSATGRMISDYAAWKSASEHRQISRSQVILKAVLGVIRRDTAFSRFNAKADED